MRLFWAALLAALTAWGQTPPLYKNADAPLEKRVDDLLSRLTTPEKVSQMMNESPAIERATKQASGSRGQRSSAPGPLT